MCVFIHQPTTDRPTVANKGDTEPERIETRSKVDEDRKHEYPCKPLETPLRRMLLNLDALSLTPIPTQVPQNAEF